MSRVLLLLVLGLALAIGAMGCSDSDDDVVVIQTDCRTIVVKDINGDGNPDLIIGDNKADDGVNDTGAVYVFFGPAPFSANPDLTIFGEANEDDFGFDVAANGDLNNDGIADLAVGAKDAQSILGATRGAVYIFYGRRTGAFPTNAANADQIIRGDDTFSIDFGTNVDMGDVNGDCIEDLIVNDPQWINPIGGGNTGAVHVFHGRTGGILAVDPAEADSRIFGNNVTGPFSLGGNSFTSATTTTGPSILVADINCDALDDIIIGTLFAGAAGDGQVHVVYGVPGGIGNRAVTTADIIIDVVDETNQRPAELGVSLAVGDFTGDGRNDLAVGAGATTYNVNPGVGAVFVWSDICNRGTRNLSTQTADVVLDNSNVTDSEEFGNFLAAGDINFDGIHDLVVGDVDYDPATNADRGSVFIFLGGAGFTNQTSAGADARIDGDTDGDRFGQFGVLCDWNRDGFADLAVSGVFDNAGTGLGYVVYFDGATLGSGAVAAVLGNDADNQQIFENLAADRIGFSIARP